MVNVHPHTASLKPQETPNKKGTNTGCLSCQNQIKPDRPLAQPFNAVRKIREGEESNMKKTYKRKSYGSQQPLCTSQWLSLKFVSLLIFSQLDACFSGPVSSDLTSDTEGPFCQPANCQSSPGFKQRCMLSWSKNQVNQTKTQPHTIGIWRRGESFHFRGFYLASAGGYLSTVMSALIRIKDGGHLKIEQRPGVKPSASLKENYWNYWKKKSDFVVPGSQSFKRKVAETFI